MVRPFRWAATTLLLVCRIAVAAESPVSFPYVFSPRAYLLPGGLYHDGYLEDVDHDGQNELLTFGRIPENMAGAGPYALILHTFLPEGTKTAWQINRPFVFRYAVSLDLDNDHRNEIGITFLEKDRLILQVFDQAALGYPHPVPRWTAVIARLTDTNGDGSLASDFHAIGQIDVNEDGYADIIGCVNTGFDLTPRGVIAVDGRTGLSLWFYPMGGVPRHSASVVQDVTGDSREEILIGTTTPGNGVSANGTDDLHSYVVALDCHGRRIWQQTLGGLSTTGVVKTADMDGDRLPEVITFLAGPATSPDAGQICIWDGRTGRVLREMNSRWPISGGITTADLNHDGRAELLVGTNRGLVAALDESLRIVRQHQIKGRITALKVMDFDRDTHQEAYCLMTHDTTIVVLDETFRPMAMAEGINLTGLVQLDGPEDPSCMLIERESGAYTLYDLRPAPLLNRVTVALPPSAEYIGTFVLGIGFTFLVLLLYRRYRLRTAIPAVQVAPAGVLAWAMVAQALAHELKSPLNTMKLTLQRSIRQPSTDSAPLFATLLEEIDRLGQRANAVMRFMDCVGLMRQPLALNAFLQERIAFYQRTVVTPVEFVWELQGDLAGIEADPSALGMAVENLVGNAIEAAGDAGRITIATRSIERILKDGKIGSQAVIEIMDTGPGIPAECLSRIFEPAYTTKPSGTGFGLPIAKYVIEAHGGTIDVQSREGVGTVVTITLPALPKTEG